MAGDGPSPATAASRAAPIWAGPSWAGLLLDRPRVMGVLNVTPDSFSDGGLFLDPGAAIAAGIAMVEAGADIVDIGGESTRPRSLPTPPEIERMRVLPVVRGLAAAGVRVSVDTRHADTAAAALDAGAAIVNDVSGLAFDPGMAPLVAARGCPVVLMHMRGTSADMYAEARYTDVLLEVRAELADRLAAAAAAGIAHSRIVIDPGIGFSQAPAAFHGTAPPPAGTGLARLPHPGGGVAQILPGGGGGRGRSAAPHAGLAGGRAVRDRPGGCAPARA